MTYQIQTFGTCYRSNGAYYGLKSVMGGLPLKYVLKQIENHHKRNEGIRIVCEQTGKAIPESKLVLE